VRIGIFGAGAIGGLLGARLAQAGADVTFVARGPHLAAMRETGLTLRSGGASVTLPVRAVGDAAPAIAAMMGPETALVTGINGIPYWYFHALPAPWTGRVVECVDPGGRLQALLPPAQAIGCVVYPAAEVVAPGVIEHGYGDRFSLGEPDGSRSPRVLALAALLQSAGLKAPVRPRIRDEIWVKLWGNLCFNPISALTGATLDRITTRPDLRALCRAMMGEAQIVAETLGVSFAVTLEKRLDGAAEVGAHKTSMLQDLERGRPMEIDALLGAVVELGEMTGHAMPNCAAVLGLVRERGRAAGCYV
jgi:2-dehydropantoate 2-reductase